MKWIDLSYELSHELPRWPGDKCDIETLVFPNGVDRGGKVSSINCGLHVGTHIDSSLHHFHNTAAVSDIAIDRLMGKCQIVEVYGNAISVKDAKKVQCPKVFFKTPTKEPRIFRADYCYVEPVAAQILVDKKVDMVGTNCMSVDKYAGGFPSHKILLSSDVIIVESLRLDDVDEGYYHIIALPIKINAEASFTRVIARSL